MRAIDNRCVNTLRTLSADMVEKAKSGHPGICLGAAPAIYTLFNRHYKMNPGDGKWFNRDRFVMSAGHGSALYYSTLHLFGFNMSIEDLKQFRQYGSNTPGHPEYEPDNDIDCSTGPLGQGIAMAVGMAMAEKRLAAEFNKKNYPVVDHYTYAIAGDGCLMEGISFEIATLAAALRLGKLIVLFDSNRITIDGATDMVTEIDMLKAYSAFGWQTILVEDGNDIDAIDEAIKTAKLDTERPTLIEIKTVIGYGAPTKAGKSAVHGSPLGKDELSGLKSALGFDPEKTFNVEEEIYNYIATILEGKRFEYDRYMAMFEQYSKEYGDDCNKLISWIENKPAAALNTMPNEDFTELIYSMYESSPEKEATRISGNRMLNIVKNTFAPNLFGGTADLAASTKAYLEKGGAFSKDDYRGDNVYFGVRELGMAAISNGIACHGGLRAFSSTFFVFSDYMKPAIRLAALMRLPVLYVLTHDSIAVGEDGPTHQPIEQLAMLRSTPNLNVLRPADSIETAASYALAARDLDKPSALVLSRQDLPVLDGDNSTLHMGARMIGEDYGSDCDGIIIASGSEVSLALEAKEMLKEMGRKINLLSIFCNEIFNAYLAEGDKKALSMLNKGINKRVIVEAASKSAMSCYMQDGTLNVSIEEFGASAPAKELLSAKGFTAENIANKF